MSLFENVMHLHVKHSEFENNKRFFGYKQKFMSKWQKSVPKRNPMILKLIEISCSKIVTTVLKPVSKLCYNFMLVFNR